MAVSIFIKHYDPPTSDYEYPIGIACTFMEFLVPSNLENFDDLVKLGVNMAKIRKYLRTLGFLVPDTKHRQPEDKVLTGIYATDRGFRVGANEYTSRLSDVCIDEHESLDITHDIDTFDAVQVEHAAELDQQAFDIEFMELNM
jgi:hypothetical protein